ncbi:hypothetical protein B7P43_G04280 [Cryptotermes secundus]|uniref:Uncharacterized protein n=1 Tax=Cryptotermes secundus TaxID=105785 RepID=A0A2J7QG13_9NEOP|nr:hypothetical protein B7P43_G04280 [Cryptotermes secundus]
MRGGGSLWSPFKTISSCTNYAQYIEAQHSVILYKHSMLLLYVFFKNLLIKFNSCCVVFYACDHATCLASRYVQATVGGVGQSAGAGGWQGAGRLEEAREGEVDHHRAVPAFFKHGS